MPTGNIETNSGMIADSQEMRSFVQYLNQLIDDLVVKMMNAKAQVEKMQQLGYRDQTFLVFHQKFVESVKFIAKMNEFLKKNSEYYERQATVVEKHNRDLKK